MKATTRLNSAAAGSPPCRRNSTASAQAKTPHTELRRLAEHAVKPFALPIQPFDDLSAFMQDNEQMRYRNFADLVDYACCLLIRSDASSCI